MSLHHTQDPLCPLCESKLANAHPTLASWFRTWVKPKWPEAHVSWTFRGEADQELAFRDGKTRVRWPSSKHNKMPSEAIDLFRIRPDKMASWAPEWFTEIAAAMEAAGFPIEWGGRWKSLGDGDHFQIKA